MNIYELLGTNIRTLRKQRGMTIEALAFLSEMGAAHLGRIERGRNNPTVETLYRISQILEVDLAELVRSSQQAEPSRFSYQLEKK